MMSDLHAHKPVVKCVGETILVEIVMKQIGSKMQDANYQVKKLLGVNSNSFIWTPFNV